MKLIRLPHVAQRLFNTPLAIEPGKLSVILGAIGERVLGREVEGDISALLPAKGTKPERESLTTVTDGVAMIDVTGTLVHRSSWMDAASGLASYEKLSEEIDRAHADTNVRAILLCLNSPGGEVSGMFEMAERLHSLRGKGKPIHAIAADMACSAAYLLGAACDKFYATEAAVTGSIGVVFTHLDVSEADKKAGVKVTQIHAGARKVDGNPHEPLSDEARESLEGLVNRTYDVFVARAAAYRGVMEDVLRSTEARVYVGGDATKAGVIDGVKSTRAALNELKRGGGQQGLAGLPERAAKAEQAVRSLTGALKDLQVAAKPISVSGGSGGGGGQITLTYIGTPDHEAKAQIAKWVAEVAAEEQAPPMPKQEECDCEGDEECDCKEAPDAASAPASQPPTSGEATTMDPKQEAALAAITKERDALKGEVAKLSADLIEANARISAAEKSAKDQVIEKHLRAGRFYPAQRADVELLAEKLTTEELDMRLAKWTQVTRPEPTGSASATPAVPTPGGDALKQLEAKASDIRSKNPALTGPEAFVAACEQNPALYLAHREQHRAANTRR